MKAELNDEHTYKWEMCYHEGVGATKERNDQWLVSLFANEYFYLMKEI